MVSRQVLQDLETMRTDLHHHFGKNLYELTACLLELADELDESYKAIKKSKIAGSAGGIVGGTLAAVGFGLSFVTFGASLGLCIAGGVIAGVGGVTSGGASIAEFVKAKAAKNKAKEKVDGYNDSTKELLKKFTDLSEDLCRFESIDTGFSSWTSFWGKLVVGSGQVGTGLGCKIIANTVINALRAGKGFDVAGDISSAVVPVVRTLGQAARGLHIAGGVVGAVFIPIDLYNLVSNSVELHKNTAHKDSKRIRDIVLELMSKCPNAKEINDMVNESKARILENKPKFKKQLQRDLETIRNDMNNHFGEKRKELNAVLLVYATKLDQTYEGVTDDAACVVADNEMMEEAIRYGSIAKEKLNEYNMSTFELFEKCKNISENLKLIYDIDTEFISWVKFWRMLFRGCRELAADCEWQHVSEVIITIVREGNFLTQEGNVRSAVVDAERTLKQTVLRFNDAGILFPVDLYSIILKSINVHYKTALKDAKQIREIVKELIETYPKATEIDNMIDESIVTVLWSTD